MSSEVESYVKHLRDHYNASDDTIIEKLVDAGWSEEDAKRLTTTSSLPDAPSPDKMHQHQHNQVMHGNDSKTSGTLSSLSQAMQHILLWVFTVSSSITISVVAATLFGDQSSTDSLSIFVAVGLVTFTPFAFVFWDYIKRFRKDKSVVTGRVWSIITIVLHSIAAISSGITLLSNLIMGPTTSVVVAATTICILNISVVFVYYNATFGSAKSKVRKIAVYAFIPVAVMVMSVYGIMALVRLGPLRADEETHERLTKTVEAIRNYRTENNSKLPSSLSSLKDIDTKGITYKKKTETAYMLCAYFNVKSSYYNRATNEIEDTYGSGYTFSEHKKGENCYNFTTKPNYQTYPTYN